MAAAFLTYDNFFDSDIFPQASIPMEEINPSSEANALDGKLLAHITHPTVLIILLISGNHGETIQLLVISTVSAPVGLPLAKPI